MSVLILSGNCIWFSLLRGWKSRMTAESSVSLSRDSSQIFRITHLLIKSQLLLGLQSIAHTFHVSIKFHPLSTTTAKLQCEWLSAEFLGINNVPFSFRRALLLLTPYQGWINYFENQDRFEGELKNVICFRCWHWWWRRSSPFYFSVAAHDWKQFQTLSTEKILSKLIVWRFPSFNCFKCFSSFFWLPTNYELLSYHHHPPQKMSS